MAEAKPMGETVWDFNTHKSTDLCECGCTRYGHRYVGDHGCYKHPATCKAFVPVAGGERDESE